jgi:protoporphyrinogen IX oxidase
VSEKPDTRQTGIRQGSKARQRAMISIAAVVLFAVLLLLWQPPGLYLWIKALHVIAVISWMAGLLYLPRLFIYHTDCMIGSESSETFKVMEGRLLKVIMRPAMAATWVLGLWLAYDGFAFDAVWLWIKIGAVIGLSAVHGRFAAAAREFAADQRRHTTRYWRMMNEVPTVLMIVIVILVIVKPF